MEITNPIVKKILEKYEIVWAINYLLKLSRRDMETYMPEGASFMRGQVHGQLDMHVQQLLLDKEFTMLVASLAGETLNDTERGIQRVLVRTIEQCKKLPESFIKERAEVTNGGSVVRRNAKKENNFALFEPYLTKIIDLCLQKAELLGYTDHPYDAMLDDYEEGLTTKQVEAYFTELKGPLQNILAKVKENFLQNNGIELAEHNTESLKQFNEKILDYLGFDRSLQRLDLSSHPFSMGLSSQDTRITTRLQKEFHNTLFSTVHEFGHSLYERGSAAELDKTPIRGGSSLIIHESQSRFWENMVARSLPFTEKFFDNYKNLGDDFKGYSTEKFYDNVNHVVPGLIRVDADELTYHFHVLIRFEIEKALMEKKITTKELPVYWNKMYKEYLGIDVPNDAVGVLQDVHRSSGLFGYFPTYSMGTALSAIWKEAMEKDMGNIDTLVSSEEGITKIRDRLQKHIHQYGSTYTLNELLEKNGLTFSSAPLLAYLEKKFC